VSPVTQVPRSMAMDKNMILSFMWNIGPEESYIFKAPSNSAGIDNQS